MEAPFPFPLPFRLFRLWQCFEFWRLFASEKSWKAVCRHFSWRCRISYLYFSFSKFSKLLESVWRVGWEAAETWLKLRQETCNLPLTGGSWYLYFVVVYICIMPYLDLLLFVLVIYTCFCICWYWCRTPAREKSRLR